MSRSLSAAIDLPADVETAFRLLTSEAWPQALAAQLHDESELLSAVATTDGGMQVSIRRRLPEGVPGFLKRFLPADGRVVQTDAWRPAVGGGRTGSWSVTYPGSPGELGGEAALTPAGDGCRWTVEGSVRMPVPLLGGRIEGYVAPLLEKLVLRQGEVLQAQLRA